MPRGRLLPVASAAGPRKAPRSPGVPSLQQPAPRSPKPEPAPTPAASTASVADEEEQPRYQRPDVRTQVENLTLKQIIGDIESGEINLEPE